MRFVAGRLLASAGLSRFLLIRQKDFRLRFYDSSISLELWVHPSTTPKTPERFFRKYLKPGDIVVDAGANIGFYTLLSATLVGDRGRVHAIEPHPRIARYLRGNVALNRRTNVDLYAVALGSARGSVRFSDRKFDDRNCVVNDRMGSQVDVVRLDELPIGEQHIALLKIDVEGYERFVLDGATGMLPRVHCVFFESWQEHFERYGYSSADVFHQLIGHGFTIFRFVDDELQQVVGDHVSVVCEDLIAIRDVRDLVVRTNYTIRGRQAD